MEQIRFSDLFDEGGISGGLKNMVSQIEDVRLELMDLVKEIKEASSSLSQSLSSTSSSSKGGRDDTRAQAANVEQMYSAYQELTKAINECNKNLTNLSAAQARAAANAKSVASAQREQAQGSISLSQAYSTLSGLIQQTGVNIEALLQSQRQLNIAQKNGDVAAKSAAGSYNQLYAQYNLVKNVLNAMSAEMRNAEGVGKVWEAEALRIMNAMKGMQEATGKHTLSVGDYTKVFNGLNISTQQVLREMPTLANSLQQFFIAISNNVPIFVDNLQAVHKATGSWVATLKATLSTVFSWQTALLVVLTILPKLAKAWSDRKKAVEEANESITKNYEVEKLDAEATKNAYQAVVQQTNQLKVLYGISQDVNRSWEDRIAAAQKLKTEYKDELENFTAEEIALGKAKAAVDSLVLSLVKQAEAKAYLNEISNLTIKQYDLEKQAREALNKVDVAATDVAVANANRIAGALQIAGESTFAYNQRQSLLISNVQKAEKAFQKALAGYDDIEKAQKNVAAEIEDITKRIDPSAILSNESKGAKGTKKTLDKIKDYYWEWAESVAKTIEDAENRDIALNDVKFEKTKDTYQKILDEQKKAGTLTETQERYLTEIILNLETERQQSRLAIIQRYYSQMWNEIKKGYSDIAPDEFIDDEDLSISGKYEKILADVSHTIINARTSLGTSLEKASYKTAKKEGKILNDLLREKLESERMYQQELLQMRYETGELTEDQLEIELVNLDAKIDKAVNKLKGKRKRTNIWDLLFGKTQSDEYGNVYKALTEEQQAFIKQFEQAMQTAIQYMDEYMDKRIEMAQVAVEAAQEESEAAKTNLDYEMQARANGYAHNVDLARREYEEKLAIEQQAVAEKQRLEKIQEGINTATQIGSLVTATAQLWAGYASIPIVGPALAIAATALMWGSFAAAKITAAQLANAKTYGEGGMEYINYGGSHASGNDVDFGRTKDGRPRRVEKGEVVGVINRRNVEKYGVNNIGNIIDSLNSGTFDKRFKTASVVESTERNSIGDMYSLAFAMQGLPTSEHADLSNIEKGINTLVSQSDVKVVAMPYGRIEYKGNNTRIIRNS